MIKTARIGRIVINSHWDAKLSEAQEMIVKLAGISQKKQTFLAACSNFFNFSYYSNEEDDEWDDEDRFLFMKKDVKTFLLERFLNPDVKKSLKKLCSAFVCGVNMGEYWNIFPRQRLRKFGKLVVCINTADFSISVLGNSYRRASSRKQIFANTSEDHFLTLAGKRVMIVNDYELDFFNYRIKHFAGPALKQAQESFCSQAEAFRPEIVLHITHNQTDAKEWDLQWKSLLQKLPSVEQFAGTISFVFGILAEPDRIGACLARTGSKNITNMVVSGSEYEFAASINQNVNGWPWAKAPAPEIGKNVGKNLNLIIINGCGIDFLNTIPPEYAKIWDFHLVTDRFTYLTRETMIEPVPVLLDSTQPPPDRRVIAAIIRRESAVLKACLKPGKVNVMIGNPADKFTSEIMVALGGLARTEKIKVGAMLLKFPSLHAKPDSRPDPTIDALEAGKVLLYKFPIEEDPENNPKGYFAVALKQMHENVFKALCKKTVKTKKRVRKGSRQWQIS